MADRTFVIPVSNGVLSPAHVQGIGNSVFEFLWCIDRTTKEMAAEDGSGLEGLVLGGNPIRANAIATDLGLPVRTVHKHLQDLVANGYLRAIDFGMGVACGYAVVKSKKWRKNLDQSTLQDSADPRQNLPEVRQKRHKVRQIRQPYIETVQDNTMTEVKGEAPTESSRDYFEGQELQVANDLLSKEARIPVTHALTTLASQALILECERLGSPELAIESMRKAIREGKARGETINRFWFEDQKYDDALRKAKVENNADAPSKTKLRLQATRAVIAKEMIKRGIDPARAGLSENGERLGQYPIGRLGLGVSAEIVIEGKAQLHTAG
jgi:hypothetical protein